MPDLERRGLPTWAVLLIALVGPFVIAFAWTSVFGFVNRPVPVEVWRSNPNAGQEASDRNNLLMLLHALLQMGFALVGTWRVAKDAVQRALFFLISAPLGAILFVLLLLGAIAK